MNPHEIDALKNAKQRLEAHSPSGFDKIVVAAAATIAEQCNDPCTVSIKEQFDSPLGHRRDPQGGRQVPHVPTHRLAWSVSMWRLSPPP